MRESLREGCVCVCETDRQRRGGGCIVYVRARVAMCLAGWCGPGSRQVDGKRHGGLAGSQWGTEMSKAGRSLRR